MIGKTDTLIQRARPRPPQKTVTGICAAALLAAAPVAAAAAPAGTQAAALSDSALAAQVIMTGIDARGPLSAAERERLRAIPAGAVMLFRRNLDTDTGGITRMNRELTRVIAESGGVEPFIAVDHEGGAVYRFTRGEARLPSPLSYWERALAEGEEAALARLAADAGEAARALYALGVTMNLAPLAEPLTAENRAFLGSRGYGPNAAFAGKAAAAFSRAMGAEGVRCVLKHFPGNAGADPHRALPVWNAGADVLRECTAPFRFAIQATPALAVMVSHVVVPAWDAGRNASLSPAVTGRLRSEYGFNGVILADDFSMGAVSGNLDTAGKAVEALAAGVDMVMAWPANLGATHAAILRALQTGVLPRARLLEAAGRILALKAYGSLR